MNIGSESLINTVIRSDAEAFGAFFMEKEK